MTLTVIGKERKSEYDYFWVMYCEIREIPVNRY